MARGPVGGRGDLARSARWPRVSTRGSFSTRGSVGVRDSGLIEAQPAGDDRWTVNTDGACSAAGATG